MSKFKIGDKVKYINKIVDPELVGKIGEVIEITPDGLNRVHFKFGDKGGAFILCWEERLELAKPTTLERLAELEKSGEQFLVGGSIYKFSEGKLIYAMDNTKSCAYLNDILGMKIKEIPWTPKEGETFFYINLCGEIKSTSCHKGLHFTKELLDIGNYFRTKELAEAVRIKKILKEANHG